jgi:FkbM family methyltransferase
VKTNLSPSWNKRIMKSLAKVKYEDRTRIGLVLLKKPDFWMAVPYDLPFAAWDINNKVWDNGSFYLDIEATIAKEVFKLCASTEQVILDVGANSGYFTLLGLASGCKTVTFEPLEHFVDIINLSTELNGFSDRMQIFNKVVSDSEKTKFNGWNALPLGESFSEKSSKNHAEAARNSDVNMKETNSITLDSVFQGDALYLKIDVEGHEPNVFKAATKLLEDSVVSYILFEMTYYLHSWKDEAYLEVLVSLVSKGFRLFDIERHNPFTETEKTLPSQEEGLKSWFENYKAEYCDTSKTHFCQTNIFAVHPTSQWPL